MKNLQLYIQNQKVDLFEDESVTLNQSIKDLKSIDKVFTEYTKSFTIPASQNNNKILKHIYNFNIVDTYDPRKKLPALLKLNYEDFKTGKVLVQGVKMKMNKPHAYKLTFFGNTVTLKDIVGDDKLNTLDFFEDFSFDWTQTSFVSTSSGGLSFTVNSVTYSQAIITPLITHGSQRLVYDSSDSSGSVAGNLYNSGNVNGSVSWEVFKPAVRLYVVIKAIEATYPELQFTDDFFSTSNLEFYNLYLWLHNQKGNISDEATTDLLSRHKIKTFQLSAGNTSTNFYQNILLSLNGTITITDFDFVNVTSIEFSIILNPTNSNSTYSLQIDRDGLVIDEISVTGTLTHSLTILEPGRYNFYIQSAPGTAFSDSSLNVLRKSHIQQQRATGFKINAFTVSSNQTFYPHHHMPDMKILDLLRNLFKMFNLICFVNDSGKIQVMTSDDYFNSSFLTHDITDFVDVKDSQIDVALPYSSINFQFKGNETFFSIKHKELFNQIWGAESFSASEKLHGKPFELEVDFEHHKFERILDANDGSQTTIQWGWSVDSDQNPFVGKPMLFYPIKIDSFVNNAFVGGVSQIQYKYVDVSGANAVAFFPSYYIPSNSLSVDKSVSTSNIHFKKELNEYSGSGFDDTLFNKYWKTYISDIFNFKRRLTKVKAYLPLRILLNFDLKDHFFIFDRLYRINTISTNFENGISDLELININEPTTDQRRVEPLYQNVTQTFGTIDNTDITIDLTTVSIDTL